MLSSGGMPEAGGLHQFLLQFINEAAAANIVAGVQVNLLNELAAQFTGGWTGPVCAPRRGTCHVPVLSLLRALLLTCRFMCAFHS
jgi:hypothetical protein